MIAQVELHRQERGQNLLLPPSVLGAREDESGNRHPLCVCETEGTGTSKLQLMRTRTEDVGLMEGFGRKRRG